MTPDFRSLYTHGFIRAAVCTPRLKVADPLYNVGETLSMAQQASDMKATVALFPELGISAYSNDDLFHQDALLDATLAAIGRLLEESRRLFPVIIVGAPLRLENRLFNCGIVLYRGQILGIVPKSYIPSYREFYEKRQFSAARAAIGQTLNILDQTVPFGNDLLFEATNIAHFIFHAEICEDAWTPIPPSAYAALSGATVLFNLSASNITIGKADFRRNLCAMRSTTFLAAYVYSGAGRGESTTDLAWDGHSLIYENGVCLAESDRFSKDPQIIVSDIDLVCMAQERMRMTSFNDSVSDHMDQVRRMRRVEFAFRIPDGPVPLVRPVERFPFVPATPEELDTRCFEACHIQVQGLVKRLESSGIRKVVVGVSGGLDSTQALMVAVRAMDQLNLPRTHILGFTMPGFATSDTTLENARGLMGALGITVGEIDIRPTSLKILQNIGHPCAKGEKTYDVTFENVQAGDRTAHLFRLANAHNALVLGTGDLSELALGWCTYGVGDHMSHYNVNASVPKTLIQHLICWTIRTGQCDGRTSAILQSIVDTEISPELIPGDDPDQKAPSQRTEAVIGPYALQDFNLYYITRFGFRPSRVAFLALSAWGDKAKGIWPPSIPAEKRESYDLATIKKWLSLFLYRFFEISQFKRSCAPNGPKVGSGGSLSPRGDWRAPSDAVAAPWLDELSAHVPDE
ncbi:NAD(+) synthase [Desulfosarcina sp. OttesenSCG-928-A07]|nr:NAD(+) synthase [Desulfosarcina sp. OttesenSCG-928-G17]MDL2328849.1 NAD(+) synthase [Desulfosarcina sp. OttesenSCG-928-A07]